MADEQLPVRLYGHLIGWLSQPRSNRGLQLEWASDELPWGDGSSILSVSLPLRRPVSPAQAEHFFGALLPEGQWREALAREVQADSSDTFALLQRVGQDTIGALTIGYEARRLPPEILTGDEVARQLRAATGFFAGGGGSSALPGFQKKVALTKLPTGGWQRGHGSVPSTHILKPEPDPQNESAHLMWIAESYMLELARAIGLTTFESHIEQFGDIRALVIERYDRELQPDGTLARLHQEDFAQALGFDWHADAKFQSHNPDASLRAIAKLLDQDKTVFSEDPAAERTKLLQYLTFNTAIGNSDAHAKNYGLVHPFTGAAGLTPLYDVTPLAYTYNGRKEFALHVDGVQHIDHITADRIVNEGMTWGIAESAARDTVFRTLSSLNKALQTTPAPEEIHDRMNGYVRERTVNLIEGKRPHEGQTQPPSIRGNLGQLNGYVIH